MKTAMPEVKLIEYKKEVERWNWITHAIGAVMGVAALIMLTAKASDAGAREIVCAWIYCLSFITVYVVSAVYHALPPGEKKRNARLIDHSAIPLLFAGTATPCAMIALYPLSHLSAWTIFCLGWASAIFGIIGKLFFFEKVRAAVIAVYISAGVIMLLCAAPLVASGKVSQTAYALQILGCVLYIIGAIFCRIGIKHETMHAVFHIFVLLGSITHFYVIYTYIY